MLNASWEESAISSVQSTHMKDVLTNALRIKFCQQMSLDNLSVNHVERIALTARRSTIG